MGDDGSETYRFDPTEFRESDEGEPAASETEAEAGTRTETEAGAGAGTGTDGSGEVAGGEPARGEDREFDWRGWTLVGMILLAFVVIPVTIFYVPRAGSVLAATGLSYRDAFLFLPLVPALLLGLMAVWATTRP
jgi:hypothetical protein